MAQLLLVTGPAGAGKTTTADSWASSHEETAAHVSHDDIGLFVRSGFVSGADAHRDPEGWRQWRLGADICAAAARAYAGAGIHCAVDTYLLPHTRQLWTAVDDLCPLVVVLLPDVEVAVERNARREGWGVPEDAVRANHAAMRRWYEVPDALVLDTSRLSLADVVRAIRAAGPSGGAGR